MTLDFVSAILLIVVPIAFNVAFFELGRAFDYPNILGKGPDEIVRRFDAGGAGLILRLEFVGPNERDGWHLAEIVVPIAWSIWLIALGVSRLI